MTREEAVEYGERVIELGLNDETQAFCEMAISALSTEGEYIKKEPIAKELKEQEDFWQKKWKEHESKSNFEDAHIAKAVMNVNKFFSLLLSNMPTYSFPDREKGEWIVTIEDWNKWTCSKCGWNKRTDIHVNLGYNFCPKCGADMRGGKE